jgi:hypothetical protein
MEFGKIKVNDVRSSVGPFFIDFNDKRIKKILICKIWYFARSNKIL